MIRTQKVDYRDNDVALEAYVAIDDRVKGKRPAVIVVHDWTGKNEFACKKAEKLAELGYVGFALDMYGKGILGKTKEEKQALIKPFFEDRVRLRQRMEAALEVVKKIEEVDVGKIAAIGFCFGGLCVLDLARSGADVKGVVSFHGLFMPPENVMPATIKAKVLALHGFDDPMVTPDQMVAFAQEMTREKVDWQLVVYGNTMHAFTNPEANDPDFGTVYEPKADARSWVAMKDFFAEIFR